MAQSDISEDEKIRFSNELLAAYNQLQTISQYIVRNPMRMPETFEDERILEAELGGLDSKHENIVNNEYLKMVNGSEFSNGRLIDQIKDGNTITVPLKATHAGTYTFNFNYKATAAVNLIISGDAIENQVIALEPTEALTSHTIDLLISEEGRSDLVISASGEGMLVLGHVQISMTDVAENKVTGIEGAEKPYKTIYTIGYEFDLSGLKVIAHREDGTVSDITGQVTVTGFDTSSEGTKTVTVHYGTEFSATFEIVVKAKVDDVTDDHPSQEPDTPENPDENKGQNGNATQTGDQQVILLPVLGLIVSGAAYMIIKRKKECDVL